MSSPSCFSFLLPSLLSSRLDFLRSSLDPGRFPRTKLFSSSGWHFWACSHLRFAPPLMSSPRSFPLSFSFSCLLSCPAFASCPWLPPLAFSQGSCPATSGSRPLSSGLILCLSCSNSSFLTSPPTSVKLLTQASSLPSTLLARTRIPCTKSSAVSSALQPLLHMWILNFTFGLAPLSRRIPSSVAPVGRRVR